MASRQHSLRHRALVGTFAAAAAVATLSAQAGSAGAAPDPDGSTMLGAMQRDLGLTERQAQARLAAEQRAAAAQEHLTSALGADYAGAWFDADTQALQVGVADPARSSAVEAAGARAVPVQHSSAELESYVERLDAADAPSAVPGYYVDAPTNRVVLETLSDEAAAERFAAQAGVPADAIRVESAPERPQPLAQGGDAYYINNSSRCSIGFAVDGGFVTAGHCGSTGASTSQPSGTFAGSSFPGNDYAYVRTSTTIAGSVNNYAGGSVDVAGSTDAPIGSSICRSGSTTGWHCGTIQARNATVNYAQGSVYGLIRTSVCAEPGDSGGSAISGNQAQGVTSGGSGNCTYGGTTYFQPVNEILDRYGLSLR